MLSSCVKIAKVAVPVRLSLTRMISLSAADRKYLNYRVDGDVAVIKIDTPGAKQNTLNMDMQTELLKTFDEVQKNDLVKSCVVMSAKPDSFIAGADINMLANCKTAEEATAIAKGGQDAFKRLEESKKPIVAAIMGPCLGGGLEFALACHYRIAVNDKKTVLATPEVMLGILPGAGGTQRLPKLLSLPEALGMVLTGKNIKPFKAKRTGLIDHLVEPLGPGTVDSSIRTHEYLEQIAIDTARQLAAKKGKKEP